MQGLVLLIKMLRKDFHQLQVQQKTQTNNEIKDILKVISSLENRGILLKGVTQKLAVKKDISIFVDH